MTILDDTEPVDAIEQARLEGYRQAMHEDRAVLADLRVELELTRHRAKVERESAYDRGYHEGQVELRRGGWTVEQEVRAILNRLSARWACVAGLAAVAGWLLGYAAGRGWL